VLTVADLGRLLGLPSEAATRKYIARYSIPHVQLGKRAYVLLSSLLEYLKARETVVTQEAVRSGPGHLATAARAVSRRPRVDLKSAAERLVSRVAENPAPK